MIHINYPIDPVAKSRPRKGRHGFYTPKKTVDFEEAIFNYTRLNYQDHPLKGPLGVNLQFHKQRPKTKNEKEIWVITKPDLDNYIKAVLDAVNGVLWEDDKQIVEMTARKMYHHTGLIRLCVYEL